MRGGQRIAALDKGKNTDAAIISRSKQQCSIELMAMTTYWYLPSVQRANEKMKSEGEKS
jgi:hypothetical protein